MLTDRPTDTTKLVVAFPSFAGAPETYQRQIAVLLMPISAYPVDKEFAS